MALVSADHGRQSSAARRSRRVVEFVVVVLDATAGKMVPQRLGGRSCPRAWCDGDVYCGVLLCYILSLCRILPLCYYVVAHVVVSSCRCTCRCVVVSR